MCLGNAILSLSSAHLIVSMLGIHVVVRVEEPLGSARGVWERRGTSWWMAVLWAKDISPAIPWSGHPWGGATVE